VKLLEKNGCPKFHILDSIIDFETTFLDIVSNDTQPPKRNYFGKNHALFHSTAFQSHLKSLRIASIECSDHDWKSICRILPQLPKLTKLELKGLQGLDERSQLSFFAALEECKALSVLTLEDFDLTDTTTSAACDAVWSLQSLEEIYFRLKSDISPHNFDFIAESLYSLRSERHLKVVDIYR
jgi:hypothetical protein